MRQKLLISIILVVAAFFRFYQLADYTEFLGDQGRDVVVIRNLWKNGDLFFIGPQTSIGNMYLGPYFYYLISPSLLLSNFDPIGPAILIGLFSLLTVYLLYCFGSHWFNSSVGLIAAWLFAISPTIIKYSNFIWNPNIMPLFSLLFFYFLTKAFTDKKFNNLIFATLSFIMCLNSHYLALLLLPLAGLLWLKYYFKNPTDRNKLIKYSLISALIFVISFVPQLLFDLKHDGMNSKALLRFFTERETTVNLKPYKSIPLIPVLFNQINTSLLAAKNSQAGLVISLVLFVLIAIYFVKSKLNNYHFVSLCLLYLIGLIGLGLYKQHIYDHYFSFLFPVLVLIVAFIIDFFLKSSFLKIGLVLTLSLVLFTKNPFLYPPNKQLTTVKTITSTILDESKGKPFNFALLAKNNYDPPYRYFFYEKNSPIFQVSEKLTDQIFVVCEPDGVDCTPINNPQTEIANFGWSKIAKEWQISNYRVFHLVHVQ